MLGAAHRVYGQFLVVSLLAAATACGGSSPPAPTPTVTSVAVSGTAALAAIGQTTQLTATATLSNGTTQNVTTMATWQSSNPNVATVTSGGLVTGVNFGQTSITATYQGVSGPVAVTLQLNLIGTWKGSTADSTGILQVTFVLVQSGSTVTGTGTYAGSATGNGTFTGTVSTTSNVVAFSIGGSGSGCTFAITGSGSVTNNTFSGTYTGSNSCDGPLANGLVALTKQ
jgi:hypothetical protein